MKLIKVKNWPGEREEFYVTNKIYIYQSIEQKKKQKKNSFVINNKHMVRIITRTRLVWKGNINHIVGIQSQYSR